MLSFSSSWVTQPMFWSIRSETYVVIYVMFSLCLVNEACSCNLWNHWELQQLNMTAIRAQRWAWCFCISESLSLSEKRQVMCTAESYHASQITSLSHPVLSITCSTPQICDHFLSPHTECRKVNSAIFIETSD